MSGTEELMGQRHGADGAKTWGCRDMELLGKGRGAVGRNFVIQLINTL